MKNEKLITSLKDLQMQMPRIIEAHGDNQDLTILALANPLLALKKAGYSFTPEAEEEIEATIRFGKEHSNEYLDSKKEIVALTKNASLFKSTESLADGIEKYLSLAAPTPVIAKSKGTKSREEKQVSTKTESVYQSVNIRKAILERPKKIEGQIQDPLSEFTNLDPVIPLLLKLRSIDESAPNLAKEESIGEIMARAKTSPLQAVTFRLNKNNKK